MWKQLYRSNISLVLRLNLLLLLLGCLLGPEYLHGKWHLLELISNALGALCFFLKKTLGINIASYF